MSSSLFSLLSLAGSASLDELRARSSVDDATLAESVAGMVVSGEVGLSATPDVASGAPEEGASRLFGLPVRGDFRAAASMNRGDLTKAIQIALANEHTAASVIASPTSKGFKFSL